MAVIDNRTRNTVVSGSSGNDSINNYAKNVTINGGAGNDTVETFGNSVKVEGGAGNDSLKTTGGSNVTLHGGAGNDTLTGSSSGEIFQFRSDGNEDVITNYGENDTVYITAGKFDGSSVDGDDLIICAKGTSYSGSIRLIGAASLNVKYKVGSGAVDTIEPSTVEPDVVNVVTNLTPNTVVNGSGAKDVIFNYAPNVKVNAAAGNDTVISYGDGSSINAGAGDDFIHVFGGENVTVNGGAGNDSIIAAPSAEVFQVGAGDGNDSINGVDSFNDTVQITNGALDTYALDGNDLVLALSGSTSVRLVEFGDNQVNILDADGVLTAVNTINTFDANDNDSFVDGSDDRDFVNVNAANVTVNLGEGNDTISVNYRDWNENGAVGNVYQFDASAGTDFIRGFDESDTINIVDGAISTYYDDGEGNLIVEVGSARIVIEGAAFTPITLLDAKGNLQTINVVNWLDNGDDETVVTGTDDRDIINNGGGSVTINALDGDDQITNHWRENVRINAGAGNDYINGGGEYATIDVGAGNDTVDFGGGNKVYRMSSAYGNNVINQFADNDVIQIVAGNLATYYAVGDDYVVSLKGSKHSGDATIVGGKYIPIHVGTVDNATMINGIENIHDDATVNGTSGDDLIYSTGNNVSIDAGAGNDFICGGSNSSYVGGSGNDTVQNTNNSTLEGGAGDDYFNGSWSNIYLFGSGDGNDTVSGFSILDSVRITDGSLEGWSSIDNGVVITVKGAKNTGTITLIDLSDEKPIPIVGADGSTTVLGYDIFNNDQRATVVGTSAGDKIYLSGEESTLDAGAGNDTIIVSQAHTSSLSGGAGNDYFTGDSWNATIYGGAGDDTVNMGGGNRVFQFGANDGNDVVNSFNDSDYIDIGDGSLGTHYADDEGNYIIEVNGSARMMLQGAAYGPIKVRRGNMLSVINYDDYPDTIIGDVEGESVVGTDGDDTIISRADNVTINAGAGDDYVITDDNGYIRSNIVYEFGAGSGNDFVSAFNDSNTLRITDGEISNHYDDGEGNLIVEVGSARLQLGGAVGFPIQVINADGTVTRIASYDLIIEGTDDADEIENYNDYVTINAGGGDDWISGYASYVMINGGEGDDYINGYNYASTINAGAGNNIIENGGEELTYVYGGGNDLIRWLNPRHTLAIDDGSITDHYAADYNYIIEIDGSARITVEGGDTPITVKDAAGKVSVLNYDVVNFVDNTVVSGTDGDDRIYNSAMNVSIGAGNGNDFISGDGYNSTIDPGDGEDTINLWGDNKVYRISSGYGSNVICNYSSSDTLQIVAGSLATHYADGTDYVVSLKGAKFSGDVTIKDSAHMPIRIKNGNTVRVLNYDIVNIPSDKTGTQFVNGTSSAERIYNEIYASTINAGAGDDYILNVGDAVKIDAGDGNDYITGSGHYSTLDPGDGNDTLDIWGENKVYQLSSGYGNNLIYGYSASDTLQIVAGSLATHYAVGEDYVVSLKGAKYSGDATIAGGAYIPIQIKSGNTVRVLNFDIVNVDCDTTVVNGTSSAERIYNSVMYASINAGAGNDFISNDGQGDNSTLDGGAGADTIYGIDFDNGVINGGAGNDSIGGNFWHSTLEGGDGNDTISGNFHSLVLNAGGGNDYIYGDGDNTTLDPGDGNDTIDVTGYYNVYRMSSGYGNNLIQSYSVSDTLQIVAGSLATHYAVGDDYVISLKGAKFSGDATIAGGNYIPIQIKSGNTVRFLNYDVVNFESDATIVSGTDGDDRIYNSAMGVSISAGAGNDFINGNGNGSTIDGGAGDDTIYCADPENNMVNGVINGGTGNDSIGGDFWYSTLTGGDGADTIRGYFEDSTLNGGAGNDVIDLSERDDSYWIEGNVIQFGASDGYDRIIGLREEDTLQITDGAITSRHFDSDSYVIEVGDSAALVLDDAADMINVIDADGNLQIIELNDGDSDADSDDDTTAIENDIENYEDDTIVSGSEADERIYNTGSRVLINASAGNDYIYSYDGVNNVTIDPGDGNDTIDIRGDEKIYRMSSGYGNNLIYGYSANDTLQIVAGSLATHYAVGDDYVVSLKGAKFSGDATIQGGAYLPIRIKNGNTVRVLNFDIVNLDDGVFNDTMLSGTSGDDRIYNCGSGVSIDAGAGNDFISNSSELGIEYSTIDGGAGDDTIYCRLLGNGVVNGKTGDDSIGGCFFGSTLNGGKGNDTVDLFDRYVLSDGNVIQFGASDGCDLICGLKANDTIKITDGSIASHYIDHNNCMIEIGDSARLVLENAAPWIAVVDAEDNLQYINTANVVENSDEHTLVSGTENRDMIINTGEHSTINGGDGNDSIINFVDNVTINAGAGNDMIITDEDGIVCSNIVFEFGANDGSDTVTFFDGSDTLRITDSAIDTYYVNDEGTLIVEIGAARLHLGVAEDFSFRVINADGSVTVLASYDLVIDGTDDADEINNDNDYVTINAGDGKDIVYNNASHVLINGGADNDYIYGDGDNVTIDPGAGDDQIGARGENKVYRISSAYGNNLIDNYSANDTLQIVAGSLATHYAVDGDYVVSLKGAKYSGDVTISGGAYIPIQIKSGNTVRVLNFDIVNVDCDTTVVNGTASAERIYNSVMYASINAGAGNDFISNDGQGDNSTLDGGAGNDTIYGIDFDNGVINGGAGNDSIGGNFWHSTLEGGDGNDTISGNFHSLVLNAGGGNDYIYGDGDNVTLDPGAGNDTIDVTGYYNVYRISSGYGNNLIYNYSENDTLQIVAGSLATYYAVGDDYVVSLKGAKYSGDATIVGGASMPIRVKSGNNILMLNDSESGNVPAEDYWFITDNAIEEPIGDQLDAILEPTAIAENELALTTEFGFDVFERPLNEITSSARHRQRK